MSEKILFVDDEINVLQVLKRSFRKKYNMEIVTDPKEALQYLSEKGPFAVVVSDYRMPNMNGADFLSEAKKISPDSTRIMLTGEANMDAAIEAINEGNIFRFLNKPCDIQRLDRAIQDGIKQHKLVSSEKDLLQKTLHGSVRILIDVLCLTSPTVFSCSIRIRNYARHMYKALNIKNSWMIELSALLHQIGCVSIPTEIVEKKYSGKTMTDEEKSLYSYHFDVGKKLLSHIPRLEPIVKILEKQNIDYVDFQKSENINSEDELIDVGSQIIRIATDLDLLLEGGNSLKESLESMIKDSKVYNVKIVNLLSNLEVKTKSKEIRSISLEGLEVNMLLSEDIYLENGALLVPKGQEITLPLLEKIKTYSKIFKVKEPISVYSS